MDADPMVYVVDDDRSVRKALRRLFRANGMDAEVFESPAEFLDYPIRQDAACVILDYQLPEQSGIELQAELASRGVDLPIIFMSGKSDIPISVAAMKQGAVDFLTKPVDDQVLIDTAKKAIESHSRQAESQSEVRAFQERLSTLTRREHNVLMLVIEGLLNKQIAKRLGVTEATVKVHRSRAMEKTEADSLAELVRMCERAGIQGNTDD